MEVRVKINGNWSMPLFFCDYQAMNDETKRLQRIMMKTRRKKDETYNEYGMKMNIKESQEAKINRMKIFVNWIMLERCKILKYLGI